MYVTTVDSLPLTVTGNGAIMGVVSTDMTSNRVTGWTLCLDPDRSSKGWSLSVSTMFSDRGRRADVMSRDHLRETLQLIMIALP